MNHPGFLADILANPDDDTPRLIYADWLEDQGQKAEADFIRVQCTLFALPLSNPARPRLLDEQSSAWLAMKPPLYPEIPYPRDGGFAAEIDGGVELRDPKVIFRRGFVHTVRCTLDAWRTHGPALVSRHPVQRVKLSDRCPEIRASPSPRKDWYGWTWAPDRAPKAIYFDPHSWCLPASIWRRVRQSEYGLAEFPSQEAAEAALSSGSIAWAVEEARTRGLWPGIPQEV